MKKSLRALALVSLMTFGMTNANAGAGLTASAYSNLTNGHLIRAAVTGGLGVASIVTGVNMIQNGQIGWGVFFLVLEENNVIGAQDVEALSGLDVASKEAFLEIISSNDSEEVKKEMLQSLLQ